MEKATIFIETTKKEKKIVHLRFEKGGKMPVPFLKYESIQSLDGKQVEVERIEGKICRIILEGKEVFTAAKKINASPTKLNQTNKKEQKISLAKEPEKKYSINDQADNILNPAVAPYNFVPLNEKVVAAEVTPGTKEFSLNRFHHDRHTGYIELTITTKTPLYIRDTMTLEETAKAREMKKNEQKFINSDFFSPGGKVCIPGSSLRGMIRTLVEIVSFSQFRYFEKERKYHFRSFADKSLNLREIYAAKMMQTDKSIGYKPKVQAGYLIKEGIHFKIMPAKVNQGCQFYRIEEEKVIEAGIVSESMRLFNKKNKCYEIKYANENKTNFVKNKDYKFGFKEIRFVPVPMKDQFQKHKLKLIYADVIQISRKEDQLNDSSEGFLVLSGWIVGKSGNNIEKPKPGKHLHWIIGPPENGREKELTFAPSVIENYKNDKNRDEQTNLLKYFENKSIKKVPCFYITNEKGQVISFGHTGMFRLAYDKTIGEHIPERLKDEKILDIAEAIFGNENTFAGRIFFEDADLSGPNQNIFENGGKEMIPKTLMGPKPTTFQHYLVQNEQNMQNHPKNLANYNSDNFLRGNKLYWHQSETCKWKKEDQNDFKPKIDTKIKPVKPDHVFEGCVRFENLSDVELGALLFALDLPIGFCHKLGMGKPLGLGSVKIQPKLFLSKRKERYTELFAEWEKPIVEAVDEKENKTYFKNEFAKYILEAINLKEASSQETGNWEKLWQNPRLKELKCMLDFDNKPKDERKTRYMDLKEFKERRVLPKASEVKDNENE